MKQNLSLFAKQIMASYQTVAAKRGLVSSSSIRSIFISSLKLSVVHLGLKTLISGPMPHILSNGLAGRHECPCYRAKHNYRTVTSKHHHPNTIVQWSALQKKKKAIWDNSSS